MQKIVNFLLVCWFTIYTFEAPIRYFSEQLGMPFFIYLKDLITIFVIILGFYKIFLNKKISKRLIVILIIFSWGVIVSFINDLNIYQIIFGIKVFLPIVFGFMVAYYFDKFFNLYRYIFRIFIPIIIAGLLLDYFYTLPWEGFTYSISSYEIEGQRAWNTFGIARLSGFQRTSFDSGILIYTLFLLLVISKFYANENEQTSSILLIKVYDFVLLVFLGIGLVLTTSKSAISAFIALLFLLLLFKLNNIFYRSILLKFCIRFYLLCLFLIGFIPPIYTLVNFNSIYNFLELNLNNEFLFSSYFQRLAITWPQSFSLLKYSYLPFLGRGIGGIGVSQQFFEPSIYNVADNIYVYLIVSFGFVTYIILIYLLLKILQFGKTPNPKVFYLLCLTIFTFGATINTIESNLLSTLIGLLLATQLKDFNKIIHYKETSQ